MIEVSERNARTQPAGSPRPRIAPPTPAKSEVRSFAKIAATLGLKLFPWQETAARYLTAVSPTGHPLFREVAVIVARQNGKTTLLLPLVVHRLLAGRRVMHAAQHLKLPGEFHRELANVFLEHYPELVPARRGISWRAGQEAIRLTNGGVYEIVAATGGAPRGVTNDLVVVDELREMTDHRFVAGIKPTIIAKPYGQLVYVSNAGTDSSVVLNAIRKRADEDPTLAYLEWSADPTYADDDESGWLQANPAIGHIEGLLDGLRSEHRAAMLGGTMADFETEHLCRWQASLESRLVSDEQWAGQEFGDVGSPRGAVMAVNMDISGERASAVVAWQEGDQVALDVHDTKGSPIDVSLLGPDLVKLARANRVQETAYDPYTDADLVRYLSRSRAINGRAYAAASEKFVRLVNERRFRIHDPGGVLAEDLHWTTKRRAPFGSYMAVKASEEHANTAATAAIRAAWLASAPTPTGPARIF